MGGHAGKLGRLATTSAGIGGEQERRRESNVRGAQALGCWLAWWHRWWGWLAWKQGTGATLDTEQQLRALDELMVGGAGTRWALSWAGGDPALRSLWLPCRLRRHPMLDAAE